MPSLNSTTKICNQCHLEKPVYEFHKKAKSKDGYRNTCKQCRAINEGHNYVKPAPPGFQWCRKCDTLYPATNEYFYWDSTQNKLYSSCKSCHYLRTRNWQSRNYEFWINRNRNWVIMNPDKVHLSKKNWVNNNPDYFVRNADRITANHKKGKAKRRAMEVNAPGSHTADDIRLQIAAQTDKHGQLRCWWCGCTIDGTYHLDHKEPLSRGGSNGATNIVIACPQCNLSKHAKTSAEFAGRLL
jgi:5-methylcytosine-specific restriction endonuclease McrA